LSHLRIAGHQVFILVSMNYIEREPGAIRVSHASSWAVMRMSMTAFATSARRAGWPLLAGAPVRRTGSFDGLPSFASVRFGEV
jgi:hypothetical protein